MTNPHNDRMRKAIQLSKECVPSDGAFSVGAVILSSNGTSIATGYSRELNDYCHAEEAAIDKALAAGESLAGCAIYTTMEPCSVRLSGRESCTAKLIHHKFAKVFYAAKEPGTFVQCQGVGILERAGIHVEWMESFQEEVIRVNSHLKT